MKEGFKEQSISENSRSRNGVGDAGRAVAGTGEAG